MIWHSTANKLPPVGQKVFCVYIGGSKQVYTMTRVKDSDGDAYWQSDGGVYNQPHYWAEIELPSMPTIQAGKKHRIVNDNGNWVIQYSS